MHRLSDDRTIVIFDQYPLALRFGGPVEVLALMPIVLGLDVPFGNDDIGRKDKVTQLLVRRDTTVESVRDVVTLQMPGFDPYEDGPAAALVAEVFSGDKCWQFRLRSMDDTDLWDSYQKVREEAPNGNFVPAMPMKLDPQATLLKLVAWRFSNWRREERPLEEIWILLV